MVTEMIPQKKKGVRGTTPQSRIRFGSAEPILGSWSHSHVASWLADHGGATMSARDMISELCDRMIEDGLPIQRMALSLSDYHPQLVARTFFWHREGDVEEVPRAFSIQQEPLYLQSPVKFIHDGASAIRRRLAGPDAQLDFPILEELMAAGGTDYLAVALVFADGTRHFASWTTDQPGGFSNDQLARLYDLMPLIGLRLELDHARQATRTLLTTYLGGDAAKRVIAGNIRRGEHDVIDAVLLFADLRGYTRLVDTCDADDVIRVLSLYYESVAGPVTEFGGDIVKMIGDGLLAIFPIEDLNDKARVGRVACGAVAAVKHAYHSLNNFGMEELPKNIPELRAGFALHAGPVVFGNIGSLDRLDFTVIGPAVNEVHRVETLTKVLGAPVLATSAFAKLDCPVPLQSLGFHALRGVREPKELFALPAEELEANSS